MRLARADRDDSIVANAFAGEVLRNGRRALLRESLVVGGRTRVVGVPRHFEQRLVELLQDQRDRVQHFEEVRPQIGTVRLERDVAGHVQCDVVAVARDTHAGTLQLLAQLGLLPIHVVAHGAAGKRADTRTDERILAPVPCVISRQDAGDSTHGSTDAGTGRGLADLLLVRIRVVGVAAGEHGRRGKTREREPDVSGFEHHEEPPQLGRCVRPETARSFTELRERRKPHANCRGLATRIRREPRQPDEQAAAPNLRAADRVCIDGPAVGCPDAARLDAAGHMAQPGRVRRRTGPRLLRVALDKARLRSRARIHRHVRDAGRAGRAALAALGHVRRDFRGRVDRSVRRSCDRRVAPVFFQGPPVPADRPALVAGRAVSTPRYPLLIERVTWHACNGDSRTRWPRCTAPRGAPDP